MAQAGASPWLQAVAHELLCDSWFRLPQQADIVRTNLGVRPGDALADALFYVVFAQVLKETRQRLATIGLVCEVPWDPCMRRCMQVHTTDCAERILLCDVTWMDDLSVMAEIRAPADAEAHLSRAWGVLIDSCVRRGLCPNLCKGKTEALLSVHAPGSRSVRRGFLNVPEPTVSAGAAAWPAQRLRVVPSYKHLGGMLHHRGFLSVEVRVRVGCAWSAYRARRKQIFAQRSVPLSDKRPLFVSLIVSVLMYGAGTWTILHPREVRPLAKCYVDIARAILRPHFRGDVCRLSEDRALRLFGVPSVAICFHVARLTHLAALVTLDLKESWALLHAEGHWLELACVSLQWLWTHVDAGHMHADWQSAWGAWVDIMCRRPKFWKRLLRCAQDVATRREALAEGWQQCRGSVARLLMQHGAVAQSFADAAQVPGPAQPFFCGLCSVAFSSKQQWAVHAFKRHGRVRQARLLVEGTQSPVCLWQYGCHASLCAHLEYSQRCRLRLVRARFSCSPAPGIGSKKGDVGTDFLGAVCQAFGPLHPICHGEPLPAEACDLPASLLEMLGCFVRLPLPQLSAVDRLSSFRRVLCSACLLPDQVHEAIRFAQALLQAEEEDMPLGHVVGTRAVLEWASLHWSVAWLCGDSEQASGPCLAIYRQSELVLHDLRPGGRCS